MSTSFLISLMGSLGDVVRALTLVAPIKSHFVDSKITWLVEPKCLEIVKLHPLIDRIVLFDRKAGLKAIVQLWKELRSEQYDICLDLQRHFKSGIFSKISGSKRIIGFHKNDAKELNWIFSDETISDYPETLAKIEHYWKFLEYLEVAAPKSSKVDLDLGKENEVFQKYSLPESKSYFVLVLGSSWESKDWPVSSYFRLIEEIHKTNSNASFILTGGKEHLAVANHLQGVFAKNNNFLFNLCGKSSLGELCVLIKHARCVIGPDSGPGHLAAMLAVPFIGLFGPTDVSRTAPYGDQVSILRSAIACSPCYKRVCPGLEKICMRLINPEDVAKLALNSIDSFH